jgi:hypothetical protein
MRWGLTGAVVLVVAQIVLNGPWLFAGRSLLLATGDANDYTGNAAVLAVAGLVALGVIFGAGLLTVRDGGSIGAGVFAAVVAAGVSTAVSMLFVAVLLANSELPSLHAYGLSEASIRHIFIGAVLVVMLIRFAVGLLPVILISALGASIGRWLFDAEAPEYDETLDPDLQPGRLRYGNSAAMWQPSPSAEQGAGEP